MPEEMDPILKAALYFAFFLLSVFILMAAIAVISPKAARHIEAAVKSIAQAWRSETWRSELKSSLRRHTPAFLAGYAITAGLAIVLGRFDVYAALIGCPAVAAGAAYFFNRLRRAE